MEGQVRSLMCHSSFLVLLSLGGDPSLGFHLSSPISSKFCYESGFKIIPLVQMAKQY